MAILKGYVCDECGTQAQIPSRWLILQKMDLKDLESAREVLEVKSKLDFCSPGCVIRWISRHLTVSTNAVEHSIAAL
jgi:hypothetical protein